MKAYIKTFILFLIQLIEKYEYRNKELDEDDISKKILDTLSVKDILIETDTGFSPISNIHKTQPYKIYKILTSGNKKLAGADNHILFDEKYNEIFIKDLTAGSLIQTKDGVEKVISIKSTSQSISMFDVTVEDENHRFYSNGILSHNCVGFDTIIDIMFYKNGKQITKKVILGELYYISLKKKRKLTAIEWIKFFIWKLYSRTIQ